MKTKNFFALILACSAISATAQNTANEEVKSLRPLLETNRWTIEKAFVTAEDVAANLNGKTVSAMQLTYNINHKREDGSSRPGWPYANLRTIPAEFSDWSRFDSVEMKIHATFNRIDEEHLPFIVAIIPATGNRTETTTTIYGVGALKLVRGKWVDLSIPIAKINNPQKIKEIKLFLDGSQYRQDDELVVQIADFKLVREIVSRVKALKILAPAIFTDSQVLPVELNSVGKQEELTAGLPMEIVNADNAMVWKQTVPLEKGGKRYDLDIASAKLPAGRYKLVISPQSGAIRQEAAFTVVSSPWQ